MSFLTPKVVQRLSKEIADLHKNPIEGITLSQNLDDLSEIQATITGPTGTPYEGGLFTIKLVLSEEFPAKPPKGYFTTKIFHPNVAREGDICVNTLKRDWVSSLGLRHVFLVIRCLMIEPNPDSALNADAGRLIQDNFEAFSEKARMFTSIHARPAPSPANTLCPTPQKSSGSQADNKTLSPTGSPSEVLFTTEDSSKENINVNNLASASTQSVKKTTTGLKASALLTKKSAVTKVNAKNDAAKKKALNRL